jgi:hypothetical protein
LLGACSNLPDYAAPRGSVVDPSRIEQADLIEYRTLTRDDFRALAPPGESAPHAEKLGALTCAFVITAPDTGYEIREVREPDGAVTYTARFKSLGFVARMDRGCSWWNPESGGVATAEYVLQHEQIHFALAELEAREQSRAARDLVRAFTITTDSQAEAKQRMSGKVQAMVEAAMENLLDRNRDFDEDTSAEHDPVAQAEWFQTVSRELEAVQ